MLFFISMEIIKNFAVFEGTDGCGTTTQLSLLTERLKNRQKPVLFPTFEPTNGQIGKLIRAVLKKELPVKPETLAMLFAADRYEHIYGSDGILSHVNMGEFAVSDRFAISSLVYQGIECGDELPGFLNWRYPAPEVTIFLDIEPEIAIERMKSRSSFEIYEYLDFQKKARAKYISLIEKYRAAGAKVETIDASKSANEVAEEVWKILSQMPIFNV